MSDILKGSKDTNVSYAPGIIEDAQNRANFGKDVMMPAWKDYMQQSKDVYNQALPGMNRVAQEGAGYAGNVGATLGETGESAARTGIKGLESFFQPGYGQEQYAAAMAPIQQQYQSNLAAQNANFGGAGNLGSSRQALAGQQLAGQNEAAMASAAGNVMRDINQQRLQAAGQLGQLGQGYLQTGLGAKGTQLGFAERPMDWQTNYGKMMGLTPSQLYTPQWPGQQSTSQVNNPGLKGIASKLGL